MTKENKELLLKDLCARLPYDDIYGEVHMQIVGESKPFILKEKPITFDDVKDFMDEDGVIFNIKLYLRPLSTMTEEEKVELWSIIREETNIICEQLKNRDCGIEEGKYHFNSILELEFLLSHYFDFRGLIEKGLALEAPEGMYKQNC